MQLAQTRAREVTAIDLHLASEAVIAAFAVRAGNGPQESRVV